VAQNGDAAGVICYTGQDNIKEIRMKLFLSFTGLLHAIARDAVSDEDLNTGLFYFGCMREHAYAPGSGGEFDERVSLKEKGAPAHERLVQALAKAEAEGRCRWFRLEPGVIHAPYTLLNELFMANGVPELSFDAEQDYVTDWRYPAVRDLVGAQLTSLEAVF
jgi:hypothetical protein